MCGKEMEEKGKGKCYFLYMLAKCVEVDGAICVQYVNATIIFTDIDIKLMSVVCILNESC